MAQENYKGVYASMTFPPYKYIEYPKQVMDKMGRPRLVHNQREELAIAVEPDLGDAEGLRDVSLQAEALDKATEENSLLKAQVAEMLAELQKLKEQKAVISAQEINAKVTPALDPFAEMSPEATSKRNLQHPAKAQKA